MLTRKRPHQLVDLLLGLFLLTGVAIGIGSLSPILAVALVAVVVGVYMAALFRQEQSQRRRAAARVGKRRRAE